MSSFDPKVSNQGDNMSISKRQESILELLREHSFLTVARISQLVYTSPSSVRRDLSHLEDLYLVKRTHGGASVISEAGKVAPFDSRMNRNVQEKRRIAKCAAELLCDGQTVMLDGSTTAAFLVPYIAKHKDMTLYTNNMQTAINAANYGIRTHCIGGASIDNSAVLVGAASCRAVESLAPDILFFSSHSLDRDGVISDPAEEENYLRSLMIKSAKCTVFLCDRGKLGRRAMHRLASLDELDYAVFDAPISGLDAKCKLMWA